MCIRDSERTSASGRAGRKEWTKQGGIFTFPDLKRTDVYKRQAGISGVILVHNVAERGKIIVPSGTDRKSTRLNSSHIQKSLFNFDAG